MGKSLVVLMALLLTLGGVPSLAHPVLAHVPLAPSASSERAAAQHLGQASDPGVVLVGLRPGVTLAALNAALASLEIQDVEPHLTS